MQKKHARISEDPLYSDGRPFSRLTTLLSHTGSGFDALPDELLICILMALSSTAISPADLTNAMLVNKRFYEAGNNPKVLARAGVHALTVKASAWSDGANRFLRLCAEAGNVEACYVLGMIRFYCFRDLYGGIKLIVKAARASNADAIYSFAIMRFNGSGGAKKDKDLKGGARLAAEAAHLGSVNAMREFGHCLQDGYGVEEDIRKGRRIMLKCNAVEAAKAINIDPHVFMQTALQYARAGRLRLPCVKGGNACEQMATRPSRVHPLLSDFGCDVPPSKVHIVNKFLVDWFALHPPPVELRLCSYMHCGRVELRKHEFRKCSACRSAVYCSRACQALDWKWQHKCKCTHSAGQCGQAD